MVSHRNQWELIHRAFWSRGDRPTKPQCVRRVREPVNRRDEVGVVEVVDNSSERRYEALLDGQVVGVIDYSGRRGT